MVGADFLVRSLGSSSGGETGQSLSPSERRRRAKQNSGWISSLFVAWGETDGESGVAVGDEIEKDFGR